MSRIIYFGYVGFSIGAWGEFVFILAAASFAAAVILAVLSSGIHSPYTLSFTISYFEKKAHDQKRMDDFTFYCAHEKVRVIDLDAGCSEIPYGNAVNEIFMTLLFQLLMYLTLLLIYGLRLSNKYCKQLYFCISLHTRIKLIDATASSYEYNGHQKLYFNDEHFGASCCILSTPIIILFVCIASLFKKFYQTDAQIHPLHNKYNKLVQGYKNKYCAFIIKVYPSRFIPIKPARQQPGINNNLSEEQIKYGPRKRRKRNDVLIIEDYYNNKTQFEFDPMQNNTVNDKQNNRHFSFFNESDLRNKYNENGYKNQYRILEEKQAKQREEMKYKLGTTEIEHRRNKKPWYLMTNKREMNRRMLMKSDEIQNSLPSKCKDYNKNTNELKSKVIKGQNTNDTMNVMNKYIKKQKLKVFVLKGIIFTFMML